MPRLTILAKGNADLRDSLHSLHQDGMIAWNGISEILSRRHPAWKARVIHETMTRSDALLSMADRPDLTLPDRKVLLGSFSIEAQSSTRLFTEKADAVVLSIQPDVMNGMVQHRRDGHYFYPYQASAWPVEDREWLIAQYLPAPDLAPAQSISHLSELVARIRTRGDPKILIYNLSPIVPWERLHCYQDMAETLAERIRTFNLELIALSRETGISIVDVESVIARAGADRLKLDALSLTAEGCRLVAEEVVRILEDLGTFEMADPA